jgi:hypothetical protein
MSGTVASPTRARWSTSRGAIRRTAPAMSLVLLAACAASKPAVVVHPSPSASTLRAGEVVFTDSFVKPTTPWVSSPAGSAIQQETGGLLVQAAAEKWSYSAAPYSNPKLSSVAVSASVAVQSGDPQWGFFGVGCDFGDPGDATVRYEFLLDAAGTYSIYVFDGQTFRLLTSGHAASTHGAGLTNDVQGTCAHATLTDGTGAVDLQLAVNGTTTANVFDTTYGDETHWSGGVIAASSSAQPVAILFKSFTITDVANSVTEGAVAASGRVYTDSMSNPQTGWDVGAFGGGTSIEYTTGAFDITSVGWLFDFSPYVSSALLSARVSVSATVAAGDPATYRGIFCGSPDGRYPQYIFFATAQGGWAIDVFKGPKASPADLLTGRSSASGKQVTIAGTCVPVSSGGGHYLTRLTLFYNGKQVGAVNASASGDAHPWGTGLMVQTVVLKAATVAYTNFSIDQLNP